MIKNESIIKIDSGNPGVKVAIFGGIHGNEKAGIETIKYLKENLKLRNGIVYLVFGNPMAIKQNARYTEKNLNRCFLKSVINGNSYEEKRAIELMNLLDKCDALLDLHAYNEPYKEAIPFTICEENCFNIASKFDLEYVLTNIDDIEKGGTDAYMNNNRKIGICVELGAIEKYNKFIPLGIKTAYQFLQYFGMVDKKYPYDKRKQKFLKSSDIYKKQTNDFKFTKKYCTFDKISKNELICIDGNNNIYYPKNKYILFPRENYDIGIEAFILAEDIF
jgi:succinylglutamate desuccinylase